MQITNISITSLRHSVDGKYILGEICFQICDDNGHNARELNITCKPPFSRKIRADAILIGDAIRQLRRMPPIRMGEERLRFAADLRPLSLRPLSLRPLSPPQHEMLKLG